MDQIGQFMQFFVERFDRAAKWKDQFDEGFRNLAAVSNRLDAVNTRLDNLSVMAGKLEQQLTTITQKLSAIDQTVIVENLNQISSQIGGLMATVEQFSAVLGRIDTATNEVAALIRSYVDAVNAGGMTKEQEDQALAQLTAAADKLEQVGKEEPTEPTEPPVEPTEPTV